jgi:hypothetical protein
MPAGRKEGCGCFAELEPYLRPWVILERKRHSSLVQCLVCLRKWRTRQDYVDQLKMSIYAKDCRRKFSKLRPKNHEVTP